MKKRTWLLGAITTFSLSLGSEAKAEELDQEINEQTVIINQLNNQKKISTVELDRLTSEMKQLKQQVQALKQKKESTEKEATALNTKILDLQAAINQRQEKIAEQARNRQVNGRNENFISVIFQADNMEDVVVRTMAYAQIVQANKETMEAQKRDKKAVALKKIELDQQISTLQKTTDKLASQTVSLATKKKEQTVLVYTLGTKIEKEESTKKQYEVKRLALIKEREEAARQAQVKALAAQKAAAAAQAKATAQANEAAQAKAAEAVGHLTPSTVVKSPDSTKGSSAGSTSEAKPVSTSGFSAPLPSLTVTSGYGSRNDPTGSSGTFHSGIDFAGYANQPIQAAAGGTVVASGYESGGGNHVIIKHANGYYTYYLHLNQRLAQAGQTVQAGQTIGLMGSTGNSTGVHLHFGVSTGFWSGYQNPGPFLGI